MRLFVFVLVALAIVGCNDHRHEEPDLTLLFSAMTTDADGVTAIDGEVLNNTDADMTRVYVSFGILDHHQCVGIADVETDFVPARGTWTFHAVAGKVGESPERYKLYSLQGY